MPSAKDIVVKPISRKDADHIIKTLHYSGKVVRNSQLHFGVFLDGRCGGALQFGPSLDKRKLQHLVADTKWNEFIELNRMALADWLPRNGESRSIAVCMRLLRKHYQQLRWVISFADGTQCGHGVIYQAAGFHLTGIVENKNLVQLPDGKVIHKVTLESGPNIPRKELGGRSYFDITGGRYDLAAYVRAVKGTVLHGYQLRYIKLLDPTARLTVPSIPYGELTRRGITMVRGRPCGASDTGDTPPCQGDKGGSIPTAPL